MISEHDFMHQNHLINKPHVVAEGPSAFILVLSYLARILPFRQQGYPRIKHVYHPSVMTEGQETLKST